MSANDYYGKPQQGGYYPPQGAPAGGYYPQQPQQAYHQGYGGQYQAPPPQGYPQGGPGYGPQPPPQPVYVQQQPPARGAGDATCMACLAGICLCCCAEELCECLF